ncbi:unnamed protein product [Blepharisma stoltei]|uniref:Eukaryotic translation initiation factor 3 subunit D n=1 Tax=Blepharisma stoltei TaxID=1481888 RepID=A0AAU9JGG2_9CILI|nr:unnamed protein product [Blepharisma stoltei]
MEATHTTITQESEVCPPPPKSMFSRIPGLDPTDDIGKLTHFIDFAQKVSKYEEEDSDFALVENKLQSKSKVLSRRGIFQNKAVAQKARQPTAPQQKSAQPQQRVPVKRIFREFSVPIKGEWPVVAELGKQNVDKLSYDPPAPIDISQYSSVFQYNKNLDNSYRKNPIKLNTDEDSFIVPGSEAPANFTNVSTTSADPVMRELIENNAGQVFITDVILAAIMTMTRSVYPWDVLITKKSDGKVIFDKSNDSALEKITANENAAENMPDEDEPEDSPKHPKKLMDEALRVNRAFFLASVRPPPSSLGSDHPTDAETPGHAPIAYKYRKWKLYDDTEVVVRTEIDAYIREESKISYAKVFAVNEYDSKITGGYRSQLESHRGQVLGTEYKNNSCKLSKWAIRGLLSGAEYVKLGFISRENFSRTRNHELFYVHSFRTPELAGHLNLNYQNCWGVFRSIVDTLKQSPEGKYLLIRDPNKLVVRIYSMTEQEKEEEKFN